MLNRIDVSSKQKVHGLGACFLNNIGYKKSELAVAIFRSKLHIDVDLNNNQSIMCADPVHLKVGMNDITLTEKITNLHQDDVLELIELLNQHFKQDDLEFFVGSNQHWYVSFPEGESVQTTPVDQVLNKNITGMLASSPQRNWQAIQNEVQMLLHGSEVNKQREKAGLVPVNSIWFWGGGQAQTVKYQVQNIYSSDEIQGKTFAKAAKCVWRELPENADQLINNISGTNVVILDQLFLPAIYDDLKTYQQELTMIDENYIKPLLNAWQQNKIELIIEDCNGNSIKPLKVSAWKFWQKPKSLLQISQRLSK